jgi:hypothetical protein
MVKSALMALVIRVADLAARISGNEMLDLVPMPGVVREAVH